MVLDRVSEAECEIKEMFVYLVALMGLEMVSFSWDLILGIRNLRTQDTRQSNGELFENKRS
jgi:hypothetical protein